MSLSRWLLGSVVLVGAIGVAWPAAAAVARVNDEAKLFSPEAVNRADEKIREISRQFQRDLAIDTLDGIPADMQAQYEQSDKAKFFRDWAVRRAGDAGVKGIYVLISKSPGHLEIIVDRATRQRAFTADDRDSLAKEMLSLLKEKRYDAALAKAVNFVESRLRDHQARAAAPAPAQPHPGGAAPNAAQPHPGGAPPNQVNASPVLSWICLGLVGLAGVWLVFAVLRMLFGGGRGYGPGGAGPGGYGPGYGGGGGGGFLSSMLGGMFGAAAGNWIYDSFRGGEGHGGSWGGGTTSGDAGASPESGAGDFSGDPGGGGDFGGGGGGGDFGGGGVGGGDFGGGGGGGDF